MNAKEKRSPTLRVRDKELIKDHGSEEDQADLESLIKIEATLHKLKEELKKANANLHKKLPGIRKDSKESRQFWDDLGKDHSKSPKSKPKSKPKPQKSKTTPPEYMSEKHKKASEKLEAYEKRNADRRKKLRETAAIKRAKIQVREITEAYKRNQERKASGTDVD